MQTPRPESFDTREVERALWRHSDVARLVEDAAAELPAGRDYTEIPLPITRCEAEELLTEVGIGEWVVRPGGNIGPTLYCPYGGGDYMGVWHEGMPADGHPEINLVVSRERVGIDAFNRAIGLSLAYSRGTIIATEEGPARNWTGFQLLAIGTTATAETQFFNLQCVTHGGELVMRGYCDRPADTVETQLFTSRLRDFLTFIPKPRRNI